MATPLRAVIGFIPLLLGGVGFWPPSVIAMAGGLGGVTPLALYVSPSIYLLHMGQGGDLGDAENQPEWLSQVDAFPERCRVCVTHGSLNPGNSFPLPLWKTHLLSEKTR